MTMFQQFLKDEDGAMTIEWVALAAGVILLAIGVVAILEDDLEAVASSIGDNLMNMSSTISTEIGTELQ